MSIEKKHVCHAIANENKRELTEDELDAVAGGGKYTVVNGWRYEGPIGGSGWRGGCGGYMGGDN